MKIATWNLERGGRTRAARSAQDEVLARLRADVVVLTEVPASIVRGAHVVTSPPRRAGRDGEEAWCAIVSDGVAPIDFPLPYERMAVAARVRNGARDVIVYGAVLPWLAVTSHAPEMVRAGEDSFATFARVLSEQAADVVALAERFGAPVLWAGDFNQSLDGPLAGGSSARRTLLEATLASIGFTAWNRHAEHAQTGLCAVDLVCGPSMCRVLAQGRIDSREGAMQLSDHAGYWVDLELGA